MKDGIDYLEADRDAVLNCISDTQHDLKVGYLAGWNAAIEAVAARAKAEPAGEGARYFASKGGYYVVKDGQAMFYGVDGTVCDVTVFWVSKAVDTGWAREVPTLAEARRVVGFTEEKE